MNREGAGLEVTRGGDCDICLEEKDDTTPVVHVIEIVKDGLGGSYIETITSICEECYAGVTSWIKPFIKGRNDDELH